MTSKRLKFLCIMLMAILVLSIAAVGCSPSDEDSNAVNNENNEDNENQDEGPAFYEGKTLEILVPFATGGGTDVTARFFAPFLNQHIPGNPAVQVVNVGGGGSVIGANEYALTRPRDGMTIFASAGSTHNPYLLQQPGVEYDFQDLKPIFTIPMGAGIYVSPSTGYKEPADLLNPAEPLIYAGISATGMDILPLLAWEVWGIEVQSVLGYEGRGPARVAFEQGESNIDYQLTGAYKTFVDALIEEETAIPVASLGMMEDGDVVRDPNFPDLPTVKEIYIALHGKDPSGPAWEAYKSFLGSDVNASKPYWIHNDAPQEAIEALEAAALAISQDPKVLAEGAEILGGYDMVVGNTVVNLMKDALQLSQENREWVHQFLRDNYGVDI